MIIIDTSVWVDHFRKRDRAITAVIADGGVLLHPYVYGELLLGGLPAGSEVAGQLGELPRAPVASPEEAAAFILWAKLSGTGIGYVDTHLLISARLLGSGSVLTHDKRLQAQADLLGVTYRA
jgi:predicted nucleic acid-binding protein